MGKRSAVVELFLGDMGSIQRELRPSTQREGQLTKSVEIWGDGSVVRDYIYIRDVVDALLKAW
jgi:nucleoside-diphosphate-sugar epimerase